MAKSSFGIIWLRMVSIFPNLALYDSVLLWTCYLQAKKISSQCKPKYQLVCCRRQPKTKPKLLKIYVVVQGSFPLKISSLVLCL
jgi:hypothetical protein